jgi:hypothetical protein
MAQHVVIRNYGMPVLRKLVKQTLGIARGASSKTVEEAVTIGAKSLRRNLAPEDVIKIVERDGKGCEDLVTEDLIKQHYYAPPALVLEKLRDDGGKAHRRWENVAFGRGPKSQS